jgi:hypothetical protein
LRFLGILGVIIAVLFLVSISFTQAHAQKKGKPDKPPGKPDKNGEKATWAVRIPTSGYMFYGIGDGYYENNDASIRVSVEKNKPGAWRKHYSFVYAFDFTLTNENVGTGIPPADRVGFQDVSGLYEITYPDDDKPNCQFPFMSQYNGCIAEFLNHEHPYSDGAGEEDYQYFWCRVDVFDQDIELMGIGDTYVFGNASDPGEPGDYLSMVARYRQECYPDPAYHDVEIYRNINYWRAIGLGNPRNIEIERLDPGTYEDLECEGIWRIWVLPVDYQEGIEGFLKVQERYCTREKNKTKWYYPMDAKGNFNFYIDFIKNPTLTNQ